MTRIHIAVLVGSLREASLNKRLASAVARLAPPDVGFERVEIGDIPLYDQDAETPPHPTVARLKQQIEGAHGVLFVTPEYNRSIPGVLKNAIDHASRPASQSSWSGKPAGILGISPGAIGTAVAQQHLRTMLAYLDMPTLGQPEAHLQAKDEFFAPDGSLGQSVRPFLQGWMNKYAEWIMQHTKAR